MPEAWPGQTDCKNHKGVKSTSSKVCCGGKVRRKVKIACIVHKHIYAESCVKDVCGEYERR